MKTRTIIYLLILTMLAISGSASAMDPVAVSPGSDPSTTLRAVIGQGCPTFSWSSMQGAVAYRVAVFEALTADVPAYEDMEAMAEPLISREIPAPALSWTPSSGECLSTGGSYVWYVKGIHPELVEGEPAEGEPAGPEPVEGPAEGWSEGSVFEVDVSVSLAGMEEAVEGTVNEYLTNEWSSTESYREVKKEIKAEVLSDVEASGASGGLSIMAAVEGDAQGNTYYGTGAGASLSGTGYSNAFFGYNAGTSTTGGDSNTFIGRNAGYWNTTGSYNTFLGRNAGYNNNTGGDNTFIGRNAGYSNQTGAGNVFLGINAGFNETGSNRLYVDNSSTTTPLIYGEFDNDTVTINGNLEVIGPDNGLLRLSNVTTNNTPKVSRMVLRHYTNSELPVYLFGAASIGTDNFVAFGGGSPIGNAATQLDLFTAPNTTTPVGTPRLTIIGNGNVGIGTQTPAYPLEMASGARVTAGGVWTDASSREYKENIENLGAEEAMETLKELNPVKFNYKADKEERYAGFIAEDVPELVAMNDRKGLSPMDIVAVLTSVVKEQQKIVQEQQKVNQEQQKTIAELSRKVTGLEREVKLKGSLAMADTDLP